ncbi:protein RKD5 [Cinnamomum micranthum f. kanehirae]|uniref:Protein RKD5 n=1 Tax=Cinnamomum micranthum f. kanehirae TaxID=337451 RepID=A0A443PQA8_9MAGN|nr:protein RKD5 [Cinnamomum micranthum f. kanehirae]
MDGESKRDSYHSTPLVPMFHQYYQSPHPIVAPGGPGLFKNQEINQHLPEAMVKQKRRAATDHVASIALTDLAKYFDLPIVEAARNLKIGLTVLKKKCREFGIPRWPHRKIKSLDTLIHDLSEEAAKQERVNQAGAKAVTKRQKMLEREKEGIEQQPFMEIRSETKRFRQDVFKQRHMARARKNTTTNSSDV